MFIRNVMIYEAVFRLSAARILALAVAAAGDFLKREVPAYGLDERALWRHSVAAAAETLGCVASIPLPPKTFTVAFPHDLGKLVMNHFLSPADPEMIHRAQTEGGLDPLAAESQVLAVHHGETGGIVAQHWKLADRIVKGILYHHDPGSGAAAVYDPVYLANLVAKQIEPVPRVLHLNEKSLARLGLGEDRIKPLVAAAKVHFQIVSTRCNTVKPRVGKRLTLRRLINHSLLDCTRGTGSQCGVPRA